jgi:hypothetical protein
MKLILHIGMPKTGSTALQEFFAGNRGALLKQGVLYPTVNVSRLNHNFLSLFLRQNDSAPRKFLSIYHGNTELMMRDAELNWQQIKNQINKYNPLVTILSGEQIFRGFQVGDVSAFKSRLQELTDDIEIVLYVRKPSAHYLSSVQQVLKASSRIPLPGALSLRKVIEAIELNFKINPSVIEYDRSKFFKADISSDFINRVLPELQSDLDYTSVHTYNESLSAESMAILQDYRAINHGNADNIVTRDSKRLLRVLQWVEKNYQLKKPPVLIEQVAQYIDCSSTELLYLANNYGVHFSGIDYESIAESQHNPYASFSKVADICVVDEGLKNKILMLALNELAKPKVYLPSKLQEWIERKEGSFYIQSMIRLKQLLNRVMQRLLIKK